MPDNDPAADVDSLVAQLQAKVSERRAQGLYPDDLEDDLDAHFRRLSAYRVIPDLEQLDASLTRVRELPGLGTGRIVTGSRVPGGGTFHRTVGRVMSRQVEGVLQQVEASIDALREAVLLVAGVLAEPTTHVHAELLGQLDAILERLAAFERVPLDSVASVA